MAVVDVITGHCELRTESLYMIILNVANRKTRVVPQHTFSRVKVSPQQTNRYSSLKQTKTITTSTNNDNN